MVTRSKLVVTEMAILAIYVYAIFGMTQLGEVEDDFIYVAVFSALLVASLSALVIWRLVNRKVRSLRIKRCLARV
jgi:uncharacterized membrane protein